MPRSLKSLLRHWLSSLCIAAAAVPAFAAPPLKGLDGSRATVKGTVVAPPGGQVVRMPVKQVQMQPNAIQLNKRAAVAYKAFDMLDPKTKQPVSADAVITLDNGKQMKAGEYYAELNRLEKSLNALGYSLRTDKKVNLGQSRINPASFAKQAQPLARLRKGAAPVQMNQINSQLMTSVAKSSMGKTSGTFQVQGIATPVTATFVPTEHRVEKSFEHILGDPSIASVHVRGNVKLLGNKDGVNTSASAAGGGSLISNSVDLVRASTEVSSTRNGQGRAKMNISVLGQTLYNFDQSGNLNTQITKSSSFDVPFKTTIPVGPFALSVTVGAKGAAGAQFKVITTVDGANEYVSATANFGPYLNAKVYAQAGISLLIVEAGVRGEINLVDMSMNVGGGLMLRYGGGELKVCELIISSYHLEALSGSISLYAKVYVPFADDPEYTLNLFNWTGFRADADLYNSLKVVTLGSRPLDDVRAPITGGGVLTTR